jgi:hypothetical protein
MAKRPPKKQKKINPLKVALAQLEEADEASAGAVGDLATALQLKPPKIRLKNCKFEVDGVSYSGKVTAYQREQILAAVQKKSDVFDVVTGLLGALNVPVVNAYNGLMSQLEHATKPAGGGKVVLGCCMCANGNLPNLSQAQCAQYGNSTWGQPADCSDVKS